MPDLILPIAISFVILALCAVACLVWLFWVGIRDGLSVTLRLLFDLLGAGLPVFITTMAFVWAFDTFDPFLPVQDPSETQIQQYNHARARADRFYFYVGLAHLVATAWVVARLRGVWRRHTTSKGET